MTKQREMSNKKNSVKEQEQREGLIRLDRMYESLRYNEYSVEGGLGEIVDNSVEAQAANIMVDLTVERKRNENRTRASYKSSITQMTVADDGIGMDFETLRKCLVLGESIRPIGGKLGIGRFGVGMTLGSISLAQRIEVYSRKKSNEDFLYTYIDIEEINNGMVYIPNPIPKEPERKYLDFLNESSGTIVVLKKCDRIDGTPEGLANYLGRTYRKFIEAGLNITLDGVKVYLHDPLYMAGPTVFDELGKVKGSIDLKATTLGEEKISLDVPGTEGKTADVTIKMSILPKEWRLEKGAGGSNEAKKRKIDQNEGVSIMRAEREVLYGHVPYITGKKGEASALDIDRWWGCEISFPPELDDYFQVRYIKRGAEPIPMLRDKIRAVIDKVVKTARNTIRADWQYQESEENKESGTYGNAEETMAKINHKLARNKRGQDISDKEADKKLKELAGVIGQDSDKEETERKIDELKKKPYSIQTVSYPQTILFETEPILNSIIIKLNSNHPFCKKILLPLCGSLDEDNDVDRFNEKNRIKDAILLLLFAYAKAEASFIDNVELFENLRAQWGTVLATAINEYDGNREH